MRTSPFNQDTMHGPSYRCDRPRQNQPYCTGPQSEITARIVTQGDYYRFSLFGMDQ